MNHGLGVQFKNVALRPLAHTDIESLRVWRNDVSNVKFLTPVPYITAEMQETWFQKYLADEDNYTFAVDETKELNRIVGSMSLYNLQGDTVEIGRILIGEPKARGRGIGSLSVALCVALAFTRLNCQQVVLRVFSDNYPAIKAYQKCGFTKTGHVDVNGKTEIAMAVAKQVFFEQYPELS